MRAGFLEWTTEGDTTADDAAHVALHLDAFRILLLVHIAVQACAWVLIPPPEPWAFPEFGIRISAAALVGLALLAAAGRGRTAAILAIPFVAWECFVTLPGTPNHVLLTFVLVCLSASFDPQKPEDGRLALQTFRWIAVLIFVWAGLQKALHGLYFRGEFLTWMISHGVDRWSMFLGWLISPEELARIQSYPMQAAGSGPYRVDSGLLILVSNAVWVGEIAIALSLLVERLREWAAIAGILLVFTIQAAPREWMFALLYTTLLLLFVRGEPNRKLLPLIVVAYLAMLAAILGAPLGFLLKAGGGGI